MDYRKKIPAGVYGILDTVTDEIIYVGQSEYPYVRKTYHFQKSKPHLDSVLRRYMRERGFDNFKFFAIKEEENKQDRLQLERDLMNRLTPKCNVTDY